MGLLYYAHGHKLGFPAFEKPQFVTALGICGVEQFAKLPSGSMLESDKYNGCLEHPEGIFENPVVSLASSGRCELQECLQK